MKAKVQKRMPSFSIICLIWKRHALSLLQDYLNLRDHVRGAVMSWINPDWFLWGGFILCTGFHLLYCLGMTQQRLSEAALKNWLISGALACVFGY